MSWLRPTGVLIAWGVLWCIAFHFARRNRPEEDWRLSSLKASVILGVLVTLITEGLSLLEGITFGSLASAWLVAAAVLFISAAPSMKGILLRLKGAVTASIHDYPAALFAVFGVLVLCGMIALSAPPNTYDSMTYHLSRVMHWKARQSVAIYASHSLRQVYLGPWSEMAMLHLNIFSGSDRLFSLVQYFSMIGSVLGLSYIVKLWKGSRAMQWFAAIVAVTLPMGLLQSTTTQNDLVMGFWQICFVTLTLALSMKQTKDQPELLIYAGASLGLGILTKYLMGIYALPFLIWYLFIAYRGGKAVFQRLILFACIVIFLNSFHEFRIWRMFGAPGSPNRITFSAVNTRHDLPALVSNVTRNIALHVAAVPYSRWWLGVEDAVIKLHSAIGIDPNDRELTFGQTKLSLGFIMSQDTIGNFVHICLAGCAFLVLLIRRQPGVIRAYVLSVLAGFLLLCFLMKWHPWISRYHVPWFLLTVPCISIAVNEFRWKPLAVLISVMLVIPALYIIWKNENRPLGGPNSVLIRDRITQYFHSRPDLKLPYRGAVKQVRATGCSRVGLITSEDAWEYPLWVLGGQNGGNMTFEHVKVWNITSPLQTPTAPCAVISTHPNIRKVELWGKSYEKIFEKSSVIVWKPDN